MIERSVRRVGTNIEHAGQHNERVVLQTIRAADGPVTRSEIATTTGLTAATVTNITNRLLASGLLEVAGQRRGTRGQPAARLAVRAAGAFAIGLNVDRDHLTMVVVDFAGAVRASASDSRAFPMPDQVRAFFADRVEGLLRDAGIDRRAIVGIGVALPDELGHLAVAELPAGYDCWSTTDITTLLAGPLAVPVVVENDAAASAIGEMQFGLGKELGSFFYMLLTVALGGGVVSNGLYDRGASGRSGEIGFMRVDDGAGARVPLQQIVSLAGLAAALAAAGHDDADPRACDLADPRIAATVDGWVERACTALVEPMVAVNCLLNPDAVLLGGRLPLPLLDRIARGVQARLAERIDELPSLAPIRVAALAEDAAAVGAALLAFRDLLLPSDAAAPALPDRIRVDTAG